MKKQQARTLTLAAVILSLSHFSARPAYADGKDGFGVVFNFFFGDAKHREGHDSCGNDGDQDDNSKRGILGMMDGIFCHLEKDMGIKDTGNVTKTFGSSTVKCAVTGSDGSGQFTVASVAYDKNAQCWIASGGSSSFARLMNLSWSYKADKTINKGNLLMDPGAFSGTAGFGINAVYDIGSATTTKTVTVKQVFGSGGTASKFRGDGQKNADDTLQTTGIFASGSTQARFNTTLSAADSKGVRSPALVSYEATTAPSTCTNGGIAINATAKGDTPTCTQCVTGSREGDDDDWTAASASTCSALSLKAYPSESPNDVAAYTTDTSSHSIMGNSGNWYGMAATPSF